MSLQNYHYCTVRSSFPTLALITPSWIIWKQSIDLISEGNRFLASGKTVPVQPLDVSVDVLSSCEKWWASGSVGCWYLSLRIGWRSSENDCRQRCRVALESSPQKSFVEMVSGGLQWKVEEGLKRLCFEQIPNSACHWPARCPQCKGSITRETCSRYTNMHVLGSSLFLNTRRFLPWARIQAESSLGLAVELFLAWTSRKTLQ